MGQRQPLRERDLCRAKRAGSGVKSALLKDDDVLVFGQAVNPSVEESGLFLMTTNNSAFRMPFLAVPEKERTARGTLVKKLEEGEYVATVTIE